MQYGEFTATRFQKTTVNCVSNSWTLLAGTTALGNRTGTELYVKAQTAIAKLYITYSYTDTAPSDAVEDCVALETGAFHFVPNGPGLYLWGRTSSGRGKVIATEFGT